MATYDPLKITLDERPEAILHALEKLQQRKPDFAAFSARRRTIMRVFALTGLALGVLEIVFGSFVLGYSGGFFCVPACSLLLIWALMSFTLGRAQPQTNFAPRLDVVREVIHTLRDDVAEKRTLFGQIDLSGWDQPAKSVREAKNALGLTVGYYRDEWLNLRAKLFDGNQLRFVVIERAKSRKGYSKVSRISRKTKWKPPKYKGGEQELRVRLSVNPKVYTITAQVPPPQVGRFVIEAYDATDGIITVMASSPETGLAAADILGVLRAVYALLERKA